MKEQERAKPVDVDIEFESIDEGGEEGMSSSIMNDENFQKMLDATRKKANAYTDQRLEKINASLKSHEERLERVENILENHSQILQRFQDQPAQTTATPQPEQKPANMIDSALGTVGGLLHGVVDTAAFVLESAVDLVTFGKARRPQ